MYVLYAILIIVALAFTLNQLFSVADDSNKREKMKGVEQRLKKAGVTPYGSTLSHGMYIDKRTNKLASDQKQSDAWYKRLI